MIIKGKEYLMVHVTTGGLFNFETKEPINFDSLTTDQQYKVLNSFPDLKPLDKEHGDIMPVTTNK